MLCGVLAAAHVPVAAQEDSTITLTETELNDAFTLVGSRRLEVVDETIDLQPDQVVISATLRPRVGSDIALSVTLIPTLSSGGFLWTVVDATLDGESVPAAQLELINDVVLSSWIGYFRTEGEAVIVDVSISEDSITYTLSSDLPVQVETAEDGSGSVSLTVTESQINNSYAVNINRFPSVTDQTVDLQPGRAVITTTLNLPNVAEPVVTVAALTPEVSANTISWVVSEVTINGQPPAVTLDQPVELLVVSRWRYYAQLATLDAGAVVAVEITDDAIIYSLSR
jgi:hypothetical protein